MAKSQVGAAFKCGRRRDSILTSVWHFAAIDKDTGDGDGDADEAQAEVHRDDQRRLRSFFYLHVQQPSADVGIRNNSVP